MYLGVMGDRAILSCCSSKFNLISSITNEMQAGFLIL